MPYASSNAFFGFALESTYGVAASVSTFTPMDNSAKVTPKITWLNDPDFRGSPVASYDQVPGVRSDEFAFKTFLYNDVFPQLVRATLGSSDTVASVGPSRWTHTIGLNNSPNTGSQSPSYTVIADVVDETYSMAGSRISDLSLSFASSAAVEATGTFMGNIFTNPASVAANESTQHLVPAWNCAASLGGVKSLVLESVELDIKRNAAQIYTLGSQSAYSNFQGPLEVSGKISFVAEQGETVWANALVRDQQVLLLNLIDPQTNYSILFQMSHVQLENPVITQSKAFVEVMTDFVAVAATGPDVVTFGYSPITTVTTNGVSTAY